MSERRASAVSDHPDSSRKDESFKFPAIRAGTAEFLIFLEIKSSEEVAQVSIGPCQGQFTKQGSPQV